MAKLRLPGLIDVHVHLREPGGEHKEDISTGTAAAIAGGVTMVLAMPNTYPPLIDAQALARQRQLVERKALCDVGLYIGATKDNAKNAAALAREAVGLKIYLDQTYGPLQMRDLAALLAHFQTWPRERPIAVHAEGLSAALAIGLASVHGRRLHLCHVSLAKEIALIRAAKESGLALTCEVAPHHLYLTEDDATRLDAYGAMMPPLGTKFDTKALWANLDVIDCIATDHAPHTRAEKEGDSPPPGVPGLETMLPLLLTAVDAGRLSLERLVELTHHAPRRIFGLPAQPDTWVEVDTDQGFTLDQSELQTKCGWSPFEGKRLRGRVQQVVLRGEKVFEAGRIRVEPGFGQMMEPA
jgi:carbamoyl-phosphate synthase/aspartate carbamoyltransferase/dihydroorotase